MPTEGSADEVQRLRSTMRDLVALSTLPAVWAGYAPQGIAGSLADVLLSTLSLDLVFVRAGDVDVVRGNGFSADHAPLVSTALAPWLGSDEPPAFLTHPLSGGELRVAVSRFGHSGSEGVVVVGSRRPDFPGESDRLLVGVGANQMATVLLRKRAELALQAERERYRTTLSSIGDAVISTDTRGRVTFMNPVAETLTGWTQPDAVGEPLSEVFRIVNEATRLTVENPGIRALQEGAVVGLANPTILVSKDGTERPIDDSAAPIRGVGGAPLGAVLVFRDVADRKRAEAERESLLRQVESERARLADVFAHAPSFMGVLAGPTHVFQLTNDRYRELLGGREVVGMPVREALPEVEGQGYFEILDRVFRTGEPYTGTNHRVTLRRAGGLEERAVDFVYQPLQDATGTISGIIVQGVDITDRQRAEEGIARVTAESERVKRLYEAVLSATPDFVYVFSLDYRVLYANDALIATWGRGAGCAIGKTFLEVGYEPWHAEMHCREIDTVRETKQPVRGEVPYNGALGRRIYDYIFVPVLGPDGEVEAVAGTTRDVTDRQGMEQELRDADRKKDDFIALLAHELRNPLAPIRNGVQVLKMSGQADQAVGMMDRQLTHMVRLIDDLLDVSRIGRNKMELRRERVALADVVASAVETAQPAVEAAGHRLTVSLPESPVFLDADLTRLAQVFSNLLTNSAKYTHRGGQIWLAGTLQGSTASVSVRDNGIGIPAAALPNIFDMFSQVDRSIERSTGGLGIGLALVKGLTEMHGGTVTVESEGQGTTFTVTLPVLSARPRLAAPAKPAAPVNGTAHRVLVVDDNRDGAESLSQLLAVLGHQVATAYDGVEAVAQAEKFRPNLILMDVGMPRLNGYEATRRIREHDWGAGMTIIALTGWGQDGDRKLSQEAGCNGHLVKPVSLLDLERKLEELSSET